MSSAGLSRATGKPLTDFAHVQQSVGVIITTPLGSRLMRRDFGSEVPALLGRAMTPANVLRVYVAVAEAVARWEPRFAVTTVRLTEASADGRIELRIGGEYRPRGHMGDPTPANADASLVVGLS